jgi:chromosome segregation ATPase
MQHRSAFILAGMITALITTVIVLTSGMLGALPAEAETPAGAQQAGAIEGANELAGQPSSDAEVYQRITALDAQSQPQVQTLQRQVEQLAATAEQKQQSIESLQTKLAAIQVDIASDDQAYTKLASDLQAQDTQARNMLEQATAELQVAYAQVGTQPQALDKAAGEGWVEDGHEEHEDSEEREEHDSD